MVSHVAFHNSLVNNDHRCRNEDSQCSVLSYTSVTISRFILLWYSFSPLHHISFLKDCNIQASHYHVPIDWFSVDLFCRVCCLTLTDSCHSNGSRPLCSQSSQDNDVQSLSVRVAYVGGCQTHKPQPWFLFLCSKESESFLINKEEES